MCDDPSLHEALPAAPSRRLLLGAGLGGLLLGALPAGAAVATSVELPTPDPVIEWFHPFPRRARISQEYGTKASGAFHYGIDFAGPPAFRDSIYACAVGRVITRVVGHPGWGNYVVVDHGSDGRYSWRTLYAHMDGSPSVSVGDRVTPATKLGVIGSTGNSTGPHLHLELHRDGTPVNPKSTVYNARLDR